MKTLKLILCAAVLLLLAAPFRARTAKRTWPFRT